MSKKKLRASTMSKGERRSIDRAVVKAMRRDTTYLDKMLNKISAWEKGKGGNVKITVPNTGEDAAKHKYIRVKASDVWGIPRRFSFFDDKDKDNKKKSKEVASES